MAERKLDLARNVQTKLVPEAWGGKGDAPGLLDDEKVSAGLLDESKDQLTSENILPLSPQWLYSKNSESKVGNSTALGDNRLPNSLSHGTTADSVQKDYWRLDGPTDKKEWKKSGPDTENIRRWRDEERETGSLGRRDRKKEGDRESEYRKNDRRSDTILTRDSCEPRNLPFSDRWQEVTGRNTGLENWRDSKWSTRWGPEDDDSRADRKMDAGKEDQFAEKQTLLSSTRTSESDTRDKWRPRHRQEVHSTVSTAYRTAPGFGLDKGRIEASHVGFSPGRGGGNLLGGLSQSRPSSAGPIGAVPLSRRYIEQGKSGLIADAFRYPRGKLLDIYRKHRMLPFPEVAPDGLDDTLLTQSKFIEPLAFVSPDVAEEALLKDISKGTVTGSKNSYRAGNEQNVRISGSEIDMSSLTNFSGILSSFAHETALTYPSDSAVDASTEDIVPELSEATSNPLFSSRNCDDMDFSVSTHPVIEHYQLEPNQYLGDKNLVKTAEFLQYPFDNSNIEETVPAAHCDVSSKLPDDSSFLFETTELIPRNRECFNENNEVERLEMTPHQELSLFYQDPQGDIQGPFLGVDIICWFEEGFFGMDLPVCLSDAPDGTPFRPLGKVMPHLKFRTKSPTTDVYSNELSGTLDVVNEKNGGTLDVSDQRLFSSVAESMSGPEFQPRVLEKEKYMQSPSARTPVSELGVSPNITVSESHIPHDFAGQDAEEVLYTGRRMHDIDKTLEKMSNDDSDFSQISLGHQFVTSEIGPPCLTSHMNLHENDMNPLGLLWSELEGSHARHPISSNLAGINDHFNNVNSSVLDSLLYAEKQEQFSSSSNHPLTSGTWPGAAIQGRSLNATQGGMDTSHFPHLKTEFSYIGGQAHVFPHQFQKQQLQKHLPSHQNMHLGEPFSVQEQGSAHHRSGNQSIIDFEHLIELQLQEQHQRQQLHEQQKLQQQKQHQQLQQLQQLQLQLQQHQQQQKQQQLYHELHLLKQQQQKEQQQQILFEHLLRHQGHSPNFTPHAEPLLHSNTVDQILLRQQLLHELEHQPHHLQRNQDLILEQILQEKHGHNLQHERHDDLLDVLSHQKHWSSLSMEEQILLSQQHEQLQARKFPLASSKKRGVEEDVHAGGVWSVDESSQFVRTACSSHQPYLSKHNRTDLSQSLQPSLFEQASLLEQNLMLYERMQQSPYERNMHPFDSSVLMSHTSPKPNANILSALARLQGLDIPEVHGHMHPSVQARQFDPVNSSHEHQISNQYIRPRLNAMDGQWGAPNGQHPNSSVDVHVNQLHFDAERRKRDLRGSQFNMESNTWEAILGNENSKHGIDELFQKQLLIQSPQPSLLVDTVIPSFEDQDSNWFNHSSLDNSFKLTAENTVLHDSYAESAKFMMVLKQDEIVNANVESESCGYDLSGKLPLRSRSNLSIEQNQLFPEVDGIEKELSPDPIVNDASGDMFHFSDFKHLNFSKKCTSKGKAMSNVDEAGQTLLDHCDVIDNASMTPASLGRNAGGLNFYNYETDGDNVYNEGLTMSRSLRILDRGSGSLSLKHSHDPLTISTQASLSELVSAPGIIIEGQTLAGFPSSEASLSGINPKDMRFRRSISSNEVDTPEASFIEIIKSSKKPMTESEANLSAPHDLTESSGVHGGKGAKKKGKKGRQIDPSLLGFKVHSNRIMMGEIQRPDD